MPRLRCPEISRLPKSTKFTAVQWRNQTPGSLDPFFTLQVYKPELLVDPTHPAALLKKSFFPGIRRDDVGIKMMPLGLLVREERQFPAIPILSWRERVKMAKEAGITGQPRLRTPDIRNSTFKLGEQLYPKYDYNNVLLPSHKITPCSPVLNLMLKKAQQRIPMSFHVATTKARMGQFRHQRKQLETRIRAAINLIVTKGAYFDREAGKISINMDDSGRKWVMQGWAYMFYPTTLIYNMPYRDLIDLLRLLLTNLNKKAIDLENKWLNDSLTKEQKAMSEQSVSLSNSGNGNKRATLRTDNKGTPVDRDILAKMRLVELQKARSKQADLAAATNALKSSSWASTLPKTKSSSKSQTKNADAAQDEDPNTSQKLTAKDFPSKILAGKPPAIWKKELITECGASGVRWRQPVQGWPFNHKLREADACVARASGYASLKSVLPATARWTSPRPAVVGVSSSASAPKPNATLPASISAPSDKFLRPRSNAGTLPCFNCGQPGHYARTCTQPKNPDAQKKNRAMLERTRAVMEMYEALPEEEKEVINKMEFEDFEDVEDEDFGAGDE